MGDNNKEHPQDEQQWGATADILTEAVEKAQQDDQKRKRKESEKKDKGKTPAFMRKKSRTGNDDNDGEWLPPLLRRQRDKHLVKEEKKQAAADAAENKAAGEIAARRPPYPPRFPPYPYPYPSPYAAGGYGAYPPPYYQRPYYPNPYAYNPQAAAHAAHTQARAAAAKDAEAVKAQVKKEAPAEATDQKKTPTEAADPAQKPGPEDTTKGEEKTPPGDEETGASVEKEADAAKQTNEKQGTEEKKDKKEADKPAAEGAPPGPPPPAAAATLKAPPLATAAKPKAAPPAVPPARSPYPLPPRGMPGYPPYPGPPRPPGPPMGPPGHHPYGPPRMPIVANPYAKFPPTAEASEAKPDPDDDLPPFLKGLKIMYPKKAELTMEAIKKAEGKAPEYDYNNYHSMHQNGIRDMAEHLDYMLYTGSRGNPRNAASILQSLLRRPNLESVKVHMAARDVLSKEARELARKEQKDLQRSKIDTVIVQGVKDFLHTHRTSSSRRAQEHDAVEAVMTAACSAGRVIYGRRDKKKPKRKKKDGEENGENDDISDEEDNSPEKEDRRGKGPTNPRWGITQDTYNKEEFPCDKIAKRLNKSVEEITTYRNEMVGKRFVPRKQKTEEDYYLENPAGACVLEFCHSIESSWPASKSECASSAYRAVTNPISGQREEHKLRVWHEETAHARYRDFCQSIAYRKFLARATRSDPNGISVIGFELFTDSTCPCVLDYHPKGKDRKRQKPDLPLIREEQLEEEVPPEPEPAGLYNRW